MAIVFIHIFIQSFKKYLFGIYAQGIWQGYENKSDMSSASRTHVVENKSASDFNQGREDQILYKWRQEKLFLASHGGAAWNPSYLGG